MSTDPASSVLYARLKHHSASKGPLVIGWAWGLAEATLFFIVPDVYLGLVALFHWRTGLLATLATVAGAMLGGTIMYAVAAANSSAIDQLLVQIPLISPELVHTVAERVQGSGLGAMVSGPLQGIPYKLYATQAGQQHLPFVPFLLVTILARAERILPFTLGSAAFGTVFKKSVQRRTALVLGAYALLWIGVYVIYYLRFR